MKTIWKKIRALRNIKQVPISHKYSVKIVHAGPDQGDLLTAIPPAISIPSGRSYNYNRAIFLKNFINRDLIEKER